MTKFPNLKEIVSMNDGTKYQVEVCKPQYFIDEIIGTVRITTKNSWLSRRKEILKVNKIVLSKSSYHIAGQLSYAFRRKRHLETMAELLKRSQKYIDGFHVGIDRLTPKYDGFTPKQEDLAQILHCISDVSKNINQTYQPLKSEGYDRSEQ